MHNDFSLLSLGYTEYEKSPFVHDCVVDVVNVIDDVVVVKKRGITLNSGFRTVRIVYPVLHSLPSTANSSSPFSEITPPTTNPAPQPSSQTPSSTS